MNDYQPYGHQPHSLMNGPPAGQVHQQQQQAPLFNQQQQQQQSSNHNQLDNFNYISQSLHNASLRPFIEGIAAAAAASSLGAPGPSASLPPASLVGSAADSSYNNNYNNSNNDNHRSQYEMSNNMNSAQDQYNQSQNQPAYSSGRHSNNPSISGLPGMPDYSLYAATLAAANSSPNMYGGGNSGTSPGSNSTMHFNNPNHLGGNAQPYGGGTGQNNLSNIHQRTMSAMAGLGQGISQQFGAQQQNQASPNVAGSGSAPNTTGPQGGSPNYGLVGAAIFGQPGSPTSPYLANVGQHAHPHQGYPNSTTSPAAQAMSAMSSMSGIPSTNTSTSVHTPISPATAYTPSFASPSLSQQAAFNAAAAAGLGVNFTAFGMPNMPMGGLGLGSIPLGGPSISQQMGNMNLSDGQQQSGIRTVYVGNLPGDASVDELLSQVRYGPIESVKIIPDKSCAFISFLDPNTAAAFHSDANLRKVQLHGQDLKIGWGKATNIPAPVMQAVQQHGATRNVYLGNLDETVTEQTLRDDLSRFGHIDQVKIVRDKNIGFVHFLSISTAMKVITELPKEQAWVGRRVNYGKDRCAYVPRNQHQQQQHNQMAAAMAHQAASQAMSPFNPMSPAMMPNMSPAMSPMAFSGGFVDPSSFGNRTVYLGNLHPDTTPEDICNTVRGGILQEVRHIPDKHICFVTFVMPESALALMNIAITQGISIKNRRLKVGWGKNNGPCPPGIAAIVAAGGSRNVYIGNIDDFEAITSERIKADLSEFGEIEQVNLLEEKSCAFTNFMKISSAVKAIEALKNHPEYSKYKIAYGKDRVGNMARQPMARRPQNYRRDSNQHTSNYGSPALEQHGSPAVPQGVLLDERALSPQLAAAVHAGAAVDEAEHQQAMAEH